jgi:glycosyltransferase involved in cell wall biosynthesis
VPPSLTAVVPTYQSAATLERALASLARQDYRGEVDVLCVDGGSTDGTRALAERFGARVLENPARNEEEGRALGIEAARGELVLLLDADNELPHDGWLTRLVDALQLEPDVVSADCLYHERRAADPAVTRLCALIGGTDPLAVELGWSDRWAWHLGRWTGMPVEEDDRGDVVLVRIDPARPPSLGSNGFLVRRAALLETRYRPFVHSDVAGDLAEAGGRFARVRDGIVHHSAPDLRTYARKARRRARRTLAGVPAQRRGYRPSPLRAGLLALSSLTVVGPAVRAVRGYRRCPDRAWALYPILHLITTAAYVEAWFRTRQQRKTGV